MQSSRDGVENIRRNGKFEPDVKSLERRVVMDGDLSSNLTSEPPNIEILESQAQMLLSIGGSQIYPGFFVPGNVLNDHIHEWGDPIWQIEDIYGPGAQVLVNPDGGNMPSWTEADLLSMLETQHNGMSGTA